MSLSCQEQIFRHPTMEAAERNIHSPGGCGADHILNEVTLRGRPTSKPRSVSRVDVQ